jgi:hypothetical protein
MEILMLIFTVLLSSVVVTVLYLFFAPFYLQIDTTKNLYQVRFHRLARLSLKMGSEPALEAKVAWWKRDFPLFHPTAKPVQKPEKKDHKSSKKNVPIKRLIHVLKSFRVTTCYINTDLGDMQLNGILYPVFCWLSWYSGKPISINFTGRNEMMLELQNSMARMSWAWLSSKT